MQVNTETRVIDKNLVVCRTETKTEKKKKVVKIFWDDKKGKSSPFFLKKKEPTRQSVSFTYSTAFIICVASTLVQ